MIVSSIHPARQGVFFDIDGTLLPAPSLEWRFVAYLAAHDDISVSQIGRWLIRSATLMHKGPHAAFVENKTYLRDLPESLVEMWRRSLSWSEIMTEGNGRSRLHFFDEAIEKLKCHANSGHRIFLLSGTLAPLARLVAARLSEILRVEIGVCASELLACGGFWTGELSGRHVSGKEKSQVIARVARRHDLSLADSFSYADQISDAWALQAVGHPLAVNPSRRLLRYANGRGWTIHKWFWVDSLSSRPIPAPAHFQVGR